MMAGGRPQRARRRAARGRERGVALILVLGSLTILAVMLSEIQDEMSVEFGSALSERDALKAEYAARSAINLSRLLIASEPTVRESAGLLMQLLGGGKKPPQIPVWEFSDQILGVFSDGAGAERFAALTGTGISQKAELGLGDASFDVEIIDEDAKIGLNKASKSVFEVQDLARQLLALMGNPQFDPLFEERGPDGRHSSRMDICGAIIDWVDFNQDFESCDTSGVARGNSPPEDAYYQNLEDPYQRKNAPFDSLEELHMVRGVSDAFWATFVEPRYADPRQRPITVWGGAKLNMNTASPLALWSQVCMAAIPGTEVCENPSTQSAFITALRMAQSLFGGIPLFSSPGQLKQALEGKGQLATFLETFEIPPVVFLPGGSFEKGLTNESKVFSIHAVGRVVSGQRQTQVRVMAVVDFRKAPTVAGQPISIAQQAAQGALGGAGAPPPSANATAAGQTSQIAAAVTPSTGGEVVYYRVN